MKTDDALLPEPRKQPRELADGIPVVVWSWCREARGPSIPLKMTVCFLFTVLATSPGAIAQPSSPVAYTIILTNPEQHLVEVQIFLPEGAAQRELQLPVWNALYQVRNFAQYVNWVRAKDRAGRALAVRKQDKSRWQIAGAQDGAIVDYQIFVDSPGAFGAQLNSHHAFF